MDAGATLDASLRSWVESANDPTTDFPIQNLPFGVFARSFPLLGVPLIPEVGVAIGSKILSLAACAEAGLLDGMRGFREQPFDTPGDLTQMMQMGREWATTLRGRVAEILEASNRAAAKRASELLLEQSAVTMLLPAVIGNYSDFYASIHHATNVGTMLRPDNPLLPNYKYIPIGYHGRASSIVVSGTHVKRPRGQTRDGDAPPVFGPSRRLDYEAEIGAFVGGSNRLGEPIPLDDAERHLFGFCIVNDWSARDVQAWEYQPLGPFLAKSFATTISPWVVTTDALEPFRVPAEPRAAGDPAPLPYLSSDANATRGGFDVTVEVWLRSAQMRGQGADAVRVSRGSMRRMYWTFAQILTHHASNGCNLTAGDLIASGTISGPEKENRGCLLERTWRGTEPIELPTGERRAFLEDGDEVIMRAYCERDGYRRIGFGECSGTVISAG